MSKAAHPSRGLGSSNPRYRRSWQLHHHGGGFCSMFVFCVMVLSGHCHLWYVDKYQTIILMWGYMRYKVGHPHLHHTPCSSLWCCPCWRNPGCRQHQRWHQHHCIIIVVAGSIVLRVIIATLSLAIALLDLWTMCHTVSNPIFLCLCHMFLFLSCMLPATPPAAAAAPEITDIVVALVHTGSVAPLAATFSWPSTSFLQWWTMAARAYPCAWTIESGRGRMLLWHLTAPSFLHTFLYDTKLTDDHPDPTIIKLLEDPIMWGHFLNQTIT